MGKISEWFNFDDIGTKIKNFAKWSCWIEIILVWIGAIITFIFLIADDWTAYLCWIPLVSAIVLPFLIWISSWTLYAFGELVENSNSTNNVVKKIENNTHNLKNNHQEKQEIKETKNSIKNQEKTKSSSVNVKLIANNTPNANEVFCKTCGADITFDKSACHVCKSKIVNTANKTSTIEVTETNHNDICETCGADISSDTSICHVCGQKIK